MRVILYLALFLFTSVSAGERNSPETFESLDSKFSQLDAACYLQQPEAEETEECVNAAHRPAPNYGFSPPHLQSPIQGKALQPTDYSRIRAPPPL